MNFRFIILFNTILFISCNEINHNNEENKHSGVDSASNVNKDSVILNSKKVEYIINEKGLTDDPDSSLAQYLFNEYKTLNFDDNFEEFVRWELEHEKIEVIIQGMYGTKPNFRMISDSLEKYRFDFVNYTRKILLDDYETLVVLTGPPLDFLFSIRDSATIDLMKKALGNKNLPKDEKDEIVAKLKLIK